MTQEEMGSSPIISLVPLILPVTFFFFFSPARNRTDLYYGIVLGQSLHPPNPQNRTCIDLITKGLPKQYIQINRGSAEILNNMTKCRLLHNLLL